MVKRTTIGVLSVILIPGCCIDCDAGNSETRKFEFRGSPSGELQTSGATEMARLRKAVTVRIAPGASFDLNVDDYASLGTPTPAPIASAAVDPDIASVEVVEDGLLRINGVARGTTRVNFTGTADRDEVEDSVQVTVEKPNALDLFEGCPDTQPYWTGFPAVVRYALQGPPPEGVFDSRIWGTGVVPLKANDQLTLRPEASNGFEWVFDVPAEPIDTTLHSSLPEPKSYPQTPLTIKTQAVSPIAGAKLLEISTGAIIEHVISAPLGGEHFVRGFPVGEDGSLMCNTIVKVEAVASPGCFVRAMQGGVKNSTLKATSPTGTFIVSAGKEAGLCTVTFALVPSAAWAVAKTADLSMERSFRFYDVNSETARGGGGAIDHTSDDD